MSSDNSGKGKPETKQHHKGIITYRHFQLCCTPHSVFEPCVMRELLHTPGNSPGAVLTSTEGSETKFSGFRDVFGAGFTEFDPFFCVYHPSGLHLGGLGRGCEISGAPPHLQCSDLDLGAWRLGPALWVGGGYGAENEKAFFHQEEFDRGASSSSCSSPNNTGQPHQIRPGLGDWDVLKKDRGSRKRAREMFSWEISHSLFKLFSGLKVPNNVSARECIFLSLLPPPCCVSLLIFFTHDGLFAVLALHSSLMFLN